MKYWIGCLYLLVTLQAASQSTEAQLKKLAAENEQMLDRIMVDPAFKKMATVDDEEIIVKKFPAANNKLLASVPATPGSEGQMSGYLKNLYTAYKTKMPVNAVAAAGKIAALMGKDADKLGATAVSSYYNGAPEQATLLALQAGIQKPGDPLILNNLSALLNLGGAHYHALPVLRSLVNQFPENPMLLNNLGQAFAGVGQLDTAMTYFGRCLKKSPHHPEANNTAGQIEKARGNESKAIKHFQEAIKGSHNQEALDGLDEIGGSEAYKLLPPLGSPVDMPYFNEFKYQLPRQCTGPNDAPYIKQEHADFVTFVENVAGVYNDLAYSEKTKGDELLDQAMLQAGKKMMAAVKAGIPVTAISQPGGPLTFAAMRKSADIGLQMSQVNELHLRQLQKLEENFNRLMNQYEADKSALQKEYDAKMAGYDCGEGRGSDCAAIMRLQKELCREMVALGNAAQGKLSAARVDIQKETLRHIRWEFNVNAYYGYLTGLNEHLANAAFFKAASRYLNDLKKLAYNPVVVAGGRCDDSETKTSPKTESDDTKKMDCPIDISVPFIVGKFELNCDKFSFSAGEGVVFKMEKDFNTNQSTMTIGAGLQFEGSKQWGIFSGEVSAGANQSFFVTWDKNNKISDAGLTFTSEAGVKGASKVETPGGIGKEQLQPFQRELGHKAEFGYTIGINSGWSFNDGYLSGVVKSTGIIK